MTKVSKEDIKKIAQMTRVSFKEDELDGIVQQFNDIIAYAERVAQLAQSVDEIQIQNNVNVDRPDLVIPTSPQSILAQAPQGEDNYFVVPKFVDN